MKILIATGIYPPDIGGPATYSKLLYDELPKRGHSVEVLSFGEVRGLPKIIRHTIYFFKVLNRGRKCDIIFAQDTVSVGLPAMIASKILRKKFLIRVAGDYAWEQAVQRFGVREGVDEFQSKKYGLSVEMLRWCQKFVVNKADKVITPSFYFKKIVSGWIEDGSNVVAIYNGIDFSDISEDKPIFEAKTIISAGRLIKLKGFEFLIKAMINLPEWKLFIAGDGPDKEKLARIIKYLMLKDRVFILGNLNRRDLIKKMKQCEVFALVSSSESFSFVTVEAMRACVPVVATNVGSLPEIVENGKEGILIELDNEEQLLSAIKKIDEDEKFRNLIIQNAKIKSEKFSIDKTLNHLTEIMAKL